ncbi:MAG: radical SAM protein, partial [Candidatus Latescibacterota bacterium]
ICVIHAGERRTLRNPLSVSQTMDALRDVIRDNEPVRTVSITGGEPLEQPEFVSELARVVKRDGLRTYLDTNGYHTGAMATLLPLVDITAMDIKLPSATGQDNWAVHRDFLRTLSGADAFVKIVVDSGTPIEEIEQAVRIVAEVDSTIPLVLQPQGSTLLKQKGRPDSRRELLGKLEKGQRFALERLSDVRIIPQCHRFLRVK